MRTLLIALFMLGALAVLSGCEEEQPQPASAPAPAKAAAPIPAKGEAAKPEEAAPPKYAYDPIGRRDPFAPLVMATRPLLPQDEPLTPLQTFDLGQLRLVGVIVGKAVPTAMVMAPDGKGYILKKGTRVGRNNGKVVGITPDGVQVQEEYYDFSGEIRQNVQEIQLPKREGV